jgi:glycolate oxidase iron-sulfur subunit
MQTHFSEAQLADPHVRESEKILRACVHCGFCTATCPTYVELADELDSPRGRISLIKDMLENDRPATTEVVKHIDRCLSCLACMTTCPSGVNYMHLVDHARRHIEDTYRRPWHDRALRSMLGFVLPRPGLFRWALIAARLGKPFAGLMPSRLKAMLALAPARLPPSSPPLRSGGGGGAADGGGVRRSGPLHHALRGPPPPLRRGGEARLGSIFTRVDIRPQSFPAQGSTLAVRRVALLTGCAQQVLAPQINAATIRLLTRHGYEVVVAKGAGCCGALNHHLGQHDHSFARANILAWASEMDGAGLDAIVINASGCGVTVKDYGFMFRDDPELAGPAARVSAIARDVSEAINGLELNVSMAPSHLRVAYHSACSLQHGQRITQEPKQLLKRAGFEVLDVPEGHLCCGSAGTYNLLQPEIAGRLRDRKVANIARTRPDIIAAGNIGCITQIAGGTGVPVVHTVELLDWATGGPKPAGLD